MKPMYYDEYFKANEITYDRGKYNIVRTPCGSGKTFHCLNVITSDYDGEYGKRFGTCDNYHCLYVTDTTALRESVIDSYLKHTGKNKMNLKNLEVWTYAKLGREIDKNGVDKLCNEYDYIFLDEIHQLFVYKGKFDTEEEPYYRVIIEALEEIVRQDVTLICLSATPNELLDYIQYEIGQGEITLVKDIVPVGELHKIKCYVNRYDIPVIDASRAIDEINLEDDDKLFIYGHTIYELQQLEEQCRKRGWTTCCLWSINQNRQYQRILRDIEDCENDYELVELKEQLEKCKPMSEFQLKIREQVITTGEYPTQVILMNAAYESGINIENDKDSEQRTIHVVVNSREEHVIVQARGRIRHDIDCLWHLTNDVYECETGIDNHKNLVLRLEQLVGECENDEYAFKGKDGLRKIANVLQLYATREYQKGKAKRYFCSSVKSINDQLLLIELPFEIEQTTVRKKVDGKTKAITYYTVIDLR